MSFRRSRPSAMKASARFDLLSRVILAAFTAGRLILNLGLDPRFLVRAPGLALPEETNPGSKEPSRNQPAQANVNYLPRDHSHRAIRDGAADNGVAGDQEKIMERRDEKKPAEPKQIGADKFLMGLERGPQSFVMQDERHLHGTEDENQRAHDEALARQIIE